MFVPGFHPALIVIGMIFIAVRTFSVGGETVGFRGRFTLPGSLFLRGLLLTWLKGFRDFGTSLEIF